MGKKRLKLAKGLGDFVPMAFNFSELEVQLTENELEYDPGDDGLEKERLEDNMEYEEMVVQILCNLEQREKLVFLYQLLRDMGYQIDHASFAETIELSRRQYMRVLSDVRTKSGLMVYGYQQRKQEREDTKGA